MTDHFLSSNQQLQLQLHCDYIADFEPSKTECTTPVILSTDNTG